MSRTGQPLVSVIIPCYNSEAYVAQAVQSVLDQSYRNLEIILVDDCSSDDTVAQIDRFVKADARVCLIARETPSGRPAIARNIGLEHAQGDFVCFLDADDYCHNKRIEKLLNLLLQHPDCVAVFHDVEVVDAEGRFVERYLESFKVDAQAYLSCVGDDLYLCGSRFFVFQSIHYGGMHTISVMIAAQRLGRQHLFFDPRYRIAEDKELWMRIGMVGRVLYFDELLSSYRQHSSSITRDRIGFVEDVIFFMEDNFPRWASAMTYDEQQALKEKIATHYSELGWAYRLKYSPARSMCAYVGAWRWSGSWINLLHAAKALLPPRGA